MTGGIPESTVRPVPVVFGGRAGGSTPLERRLVRSGVDPARGLALSARKPDWLRVTARMSGDYLDLQHRLRDLDLVTVCEEAGCPNIYECWSDGTATFMINGSRCTRACGFCQVDTGRPLPLDVAEPEHVADAVVRMGLAHAVITAVARDDLADGGAGAFAETIAAVRRRSPGTSIEVLIPDVKGGATSLALILDARPDVLNHNIETVARLQRAVRPSAGYARSLAVLARAKDAGLTTKSGIILGMGEQEDEVLATLADLRAVGVDIVTLGQYLRPSQRHLPVARWWTPEEFDGMRAAGLALGFAHVQASPLTRSSYHAREAAEVRSTPDRLTPRQRAPVARRPPDDPLVSNATGSALDARCTRLDRVRARMDELAEDTLLLSHGADLPWLTGYRAMPLERLTLLVLPLRGDPVLVVPALEAPRVPDTGGLFALEPWADAEDPIDLVERMLRRPGPVRLGISDRAWATTVLALQRRLPGAEWVEASRVTAPVRAVKDERELEVLRAAAAAADRVAAVLQAGGIPLIGRSEADVSGEIASLLVAEGHSHVNFAIVGSGPNAASPHHEPGARIIGRDETVVCDFGGALSLDGGVGYCSDITRTVVTGPPSTGGPVSATEVLQDCTTERLCLAALGQG